MIIECDSCQVRGDACSDCVVTALLPVEAAPGAGSWCAAAGQAGEAAESAPIDLVPVEPGSLERGSFVLDRDEERALAVLAAGGLLPPLRLVARSA